MKELPQIVRRSPRQGKNTLKSCREPLIKRLPTTFISYFEKLIGRKPHIVEAKSVVSRNAWGGHSSTAPLLLLSAALGCRLGPPAAAHSSSSLRTAIKASVGSWTVPRVRIFFLPAPQQTSLPGVPKWIQMLGRSEFALRQGFAFGKTLVRRNAPPRRAGWKAEENAVTLRPA